MNRTDPTAHRSVIDPLVDDAVRHPERTALTLIADDGTHDSISAGALDDAARRAMAGLAASGVRAGEAVIFFMDPTRDLIELFLGAVYLGAVPCIYAYPTERVDPAAHAERIRTVVASAGARIVVVTPALAPVLRSLLPDTHCLLLDSDEVTAASTGHGAPSAPRDPEAPAFLQFTSGTTMLPRGILHSHRRVLRYIAARARNDRFVDDDVIVSWLPLYHDLGLVSGVLTPLVVGLPSVLMSPVQWARDPLMLPRAIHRFRGTRCWMPNFALNHCARRARPQDVEGLDLRHWRALVLGGEPVRIASLRLFVERFGPCGFRMDALMAGYGMAENVEGGTATRHGEPPPVDWVDAEALHGQRCARPAPPESAGATSVVSCGFPLDGCEVAIVDDEGRRLPERRVGNVILRSEYLFSGYLDRPDETARVLRDGWLHSGDLGYMASGQLYVCGRVKDLVIVAGRNVYPQDLENIADALPGLRPGRSVAFGVDDERQGSERVVMVCEVVPGSDRASHVDIERELRRRVHRELNLTLGDVRLVEGPWVVKTSSGKVARAANRLKYLAERSA